MRHRAKHDRIAERANACDVLRTPVDALRVGVARWVACWLRVSWFLVASCTNSASGLVTTKLQIFCKLLLRADLRVPIIRAQRRTGREPEGTAWQLCDAT